MHCTTVYYNTSVDHYTHNVIESCSAVPLNGFDYIGSCDRDFSTCITSMHVISGKMLKLGCKAT